MEFHPLKDSSSINDTNSSANPLAVHTSLSSPHPSSIPHNNFSIPSPNASNQTAASNFKLVKDCPPECLSGAHNTYSKPLDYVHPDIPNPQIPLSIKQIQEFRNSGCLLIKSEDFWSNDELKLMLESVNQMDAWADSPGAYMKYYEKSRIDGSQIICRIENFTQYNPGLNYICNGEKLVHATSQLLSEPAILYKEKINYKLPGGAGFVPHQDVAAGWWMYGQSLHISVLVCVDEATLANGCLEVAFAEHNKGMISAPWTELNNETASKLKFVPIQTKPGDVIFFDSYVPHQSAENKTQKSRRVLYATYAKASEGDLRTRYYADKRQSFPPDCERDPSKKYEYKV
jgi:hypothetical protein